MRFLIVPLCLLPLFLSGDLILRLLAKERNYPAALRWPIAFALGGGVVAVVLFLLSLFLPSQALSVTQWVVFLLASVYIVGQRRQIYHGLLSWRKWRLEWSGALSLILGLVFVVLVGTAALATDLGHDGVAFWGFKAKVIFLQGGWPPQPATFLTESHLDYPLLVPSLEAWIYDFLGVVDAQAVKLLFFGYYGALAAMFYGATRMYHHPFFSAIFTALLVTTPQLTISGISGYVDVPLMLYILGGVLFVGRWLTEDDSLDLLLGGVLLALAVLVKREGVIYWLVAALGVTAHLLWGLRKQSWQRCLSAAALYIIPFALIAGPWFGYLSLYQIPNTDFEPLSWQGFFANLEEFPTITGVFLQQLFFSLRQWGILWWLFMLVLLWKRPFPSHRSAFFLASIVMLPLLLLAGSYLFSTWDPVTRHLAVSIERLILHPAPLAWLFIAIETPELDEWLQEMVNR